MRRSGQSKLNIELTMFMQSPAEPCRQKSGNLDRGKDRVADTPLVNSEQSVNNQAFSIGRRLTSIIVDHGSSSCSRWQTTSLRLIVLFGLDAIVSPQHEIEIEFHWLLGCTLDPAESQFPMLLFFPKMRDGRG